MSYLIKRLFAILVAACSLYGAVVLIGISFNAFFDLTSFLIVLVGTNGYMVMIYPNGSIRSALKNAVGMASVKIDDLNRSKRILKTLGQSYILFGVLGAIINMIHMFNNFNNPQIIGPCVARLVTSLLYGVMFRLAADTLLASVENRHKLVSAVVSGVHVVDVEKAA